MKVYGHPMSTCTRKVLMTLAETNTPYEFTLVDFAKGEHKQEPHTARQWDQMSGVNHSYLFFELNYTYLGGFTRRTLDLGGLGWTAGVLLEL